MASSQEENSSRKKLATETFTKPTFNYGIQVTLRNLGIYKKLLTVGAKAMHLNNWPGKTAGRKLNGEKWFMFVSLTTNLLAQLSLSPCHTPFSWSLPSHQSHKHPVTDLSDWLVLGLSCCCLGQQRPPVSYGRVNLWLSGCSATGGWDPDSVGFDFLGFLGFLGPSEWNWLWKPLNGGKLLSFVLTAEPMACEFTEVTFTLMEEVLVQPDIN